MSKKVIDCGLLATDDKVIQRFQSIAEEFGHTFRVWTNLEALMEEEGASCRVIAYYCKEEEGKKIAGQASEIAQGVSFSFENTFQIAIIEKPMNKEDTATIKKCGVASIMTLHEMEETSKLEFIITQLAKAEYLPIKESDLVPDIPIPFHLYHLMPLSGKFLKIMRPDAVFDDRKKEKMREVGEFYIRRAELPLLTEYTRNFANQEGGLMRQCRAQFLEFQAKFGELAIMLIDQSESMSYDEGKELLSTCNRLASELASSLSKVGVSGVFEVINNSSVGGFGATDRAPAVAAYAAFFAMGLGKTAEIEPLIFSALVMDLGQLFLHPKISQKLRTQEELNEEEMEDYKKFPQKSVDTVLSRRMPMDEAMKKNILYAREQVDGNGPNNVVGDKLTEESQLLGFSSFFDGETLLQMGKERVAPEEAFLGIVDAELLKLEKFNAMILVNLKKMFMKQEKEKK